MSVFQPLLRLGSRRKSNKRQLRQLFDEQGGKCFYCKRAMSLDGDSPMRATADHRKPLVAGGSNGRANMVAACNPCNKAKGPLSEAAFLRLRGDPQALKKARDSELQRISEKYKDMQATIRRGWE